MCAAGVIAWGLERISKNVGNIEEVFIMKKRWLFIPIIVGLLALGITVGGVLAQDGGGGENAAKSFAGRVAAILGLGEDEVKDAFMQAATEARQDRLMSKLDQLVGEGTITQEQAGEYLEWAQSRPSGFDLGHRSRGRGARGSFGGRMFGGHGMRGMGFFNQMPIAPDDGAVQLSTY